MKIPEAAYPKSALHCSDANWRGRTRRFVGGTLWLTARKRDIFDLL
jgi:hypothetical protein